MGERSRMTCTSTYDTPSSVLMQGMYTNKKQAELHMGLSLFVIIMTCRCRFHRGRVRGTGLTDLTKTGFLGMFLEFHLSEEGFGDQGHEETKVNRGFLRQHPWLNVWRCCVGCVAI